MFRLIKQVFMSLLSFSGTFASMANVSNITTVMSLNNHQYVTRRTLIDLNPGEYNQGFWYLIFIVKLDRWNWSCNALDDPSSRICIANKTEDLNLNVLNMGIRINESKTLIKHISYKYKCKFICREWNANQKWNNKKYWCEFKNPRKHHVCEKGYIWNLSICTCKNGKYFESIIDDSIFTFDEIINPAVPSELTKFMPINFADKKATCKMHHFYILLTFLLITMLVPTIVGIYYYHYHIKHKSKQKQLLPYYHSNNRLK